jgi:branched-chain amino acid transport system ATP-binding protein
VEQGEIVSIIGANSAGKSTLLKTISGLIKPRNGRVWFLEEDITGAKDYEIVAKGLVRVPEGRRLFPSMSVLENLVLGALHGGAKKHRTQSLEIVFELFPILRNRMRQLAGTLSGGQQQMVAIGRGLMSRPRLLMFDEPSLGLAPIVVEGVFDAIRRINLSGTTILLVEQNVSYSLSCSKRALVLERGQVVLEGLGSSLLNDERVRKAYLGI